MHDYNDVSAKIHRLHDNRVNNKHRPLTAHGAVDTDESSPNTCGMKCMF